MTNDSHHNLRSRSDTKEKTINKPIQQTKKPKTLANRSNITKTQSSYFATPASSNILSSSSNPATNAIRVSTPTTISTQNQNLIDAVSSLEPRLTALEALITKLSAENSELLQTVNNLQLELTQFKNQIEQQRAAVSSTENNISLDQQELNTNIVIRGVEVKEDTPTSELLAVYEGLRSHLNISNEADLLPVSVSVLKSNSAKPNTSIRPIRVQLPTVAAKAKLLQVRRVKKDIHPSDIGLNSASRRPILISEQLTRSNQELLYQARSLRGQDKFKFVWSTNGQILARQKENSKVIRIIDCAHVNRLRAEFHLEPLPEHGRLHTSTTIQHDSNNT